jgi:hypothetical protein
MRPLSRQHNKYCQLCEKAQRGDSMSAKSRQPALLQSKEEPIESPEAALQVDGGEGKASVSKYHSGL